MLGAFARGEIDVLVGTQMVAKGHDFPGVTLVGVVDADAGLACRTSAPPSAPSSCSPRWPAAPAAATSPATSSCRPSAPTTTRSPWRRRDFPAFFDREVKLREDLRYPPFARFLEVTGLGRDRPQLHAAMLQPESWLRALGGREGFQVLGPAPSPIPRLRGRFREQLLVKGGLADERERELLHRLADISRTAAGVEFQVDVDPANML